MTTSADITPGIIGPAPVSKQAMKQQLQNIKDAIGGVEGLKGWQLLSQVYLNAPVNEARLTLPDGYRRYRIEFQDVRADGGTDAALNMLASNTGGVTFLTGGSDYDWSVMEYSGTTVAAYTGTGALLALTDTIEGTAFGAHGYIDIVSQKNILNWESFFVFSTVPTRKMRKGFAQINSTGIDTLQFSLTGYVNMAIGATFAVLARAT